MMLMNFIICNPLGDSICICIHIHLRKNFVACVGMETQPVSSQSTSQLYDGTQLVMSLNDYASS